MAAVCPRCGASVVWALTQTGRRLPLDVRPLPGHAPSGWVLDGPVARLANPARDHSALPRHQHHWVTCAGVGARKIWLVADTEATVPETRLATAAHTTFPRSSPDIRPTIARRVRRPILPPVLAALRSLLAPRLRWETVSIRRRPSLG